MDREELKLDLRDLKTVILGLSIWILTTIIEEFLVFLSSVDIKITLEISGKNLSVIAFVLLTLLVCFSIHYFYYSKK